VPSGAQGGHVFFFLIEKRRGRWLLPTPYGKGGEDCWLAEEKTEATPAPLYPRSPRRKIRGEGRVRSVGGTEGARRLNCGAFWERFLPQQEKEGSAPQEGKEAGLIQTRLASKVSDHKKNTEGERGVSGACQPAAKKWTIFERKRKGGGRAPTLSSSKKRKPPGAPKVARRKGSGFRGGRFGSIATT